MSDSVNKLSQETLRKMTRDHHLDEIEKKAEYALDFLLKERNAHYPIKPEPQGIDYAIWAATDVFHLVKKLRITL
jgi:hypothetical protein